MKDKAKKTYKEFKLTTIALKNKNTVYILAVVIALFGLISYEQLPKELFPDVAAPYVMVQTAYPGNSPLDIENLVTRPIEKEIEGTNGIKEITSTSAQDASMIFIEFNFDVDINRALQDVKDAVDQAKSELPNDLPADPAVSELDFSEFPFININLSGDYSTKELKDFAEILEDRFEPIKEVSKVEIQGINEREIKIHVDQHKLEAYDMSFRDIETAVVNENMSISAGEVKLGETRRSVRTVGEFESMEELRNIPVKNENQNVVYLKDVANVIDGYEDPTSFARLDEEPVVSIQVVKKGGENLLNATANIKEELKNVQEEHLLPANLNISITNDQSDMVKKQLTNLENSLIISIIFVVIVLFFFLGTRNALFVGFAIPMSMLLSFVILGLADFKINMMVLFGLILALGMLVDNAIVVVENIHRFVSEGYNKWQAAKYAVGEIAVPIIASTATTLAAFLPLAFWDSITGEFMKFLPITLIIVLTSSLFVALVIIPVISGTLIKKGEQNDKTSPKKGIKIAAILIATSVLFYIVKFNILGSLLVIAAIVTLFNVFIFTHIGQWFQNVFLVALERVYTKVLKFALSGYNLIFFFLGTILLLVLTMGWYFSSNPKVLFFPENEPGYINILAELPVGTDINATDTFMVKMEEDVKEIIGERSKIVESILTNVGTGAVLEDGGGSGQGAKPNKGLITINFEDFEFRGDYKTSKIMRELSDQLSQRYPGVTLTIEKNRMGPPTGNPINIEVSGKEFNKLLAESDEILQAIDDANINGIEGMKMDLDIGKPEMIVTVKREQARRFGLSTGQIGSTLRTALFGKEISDFKVGEDEYPIQLRLQNKYRYDISSLMNQKIVFRNNQGRLIKVPISAVASFKYSTTYGSVKRKDLERVITLYSNVIEGYNPTEVNEQIKLALTEIDLPEGYNYKFTGEQKDQQESMNFLIRAMLIAISLILMILVSQFNSMIKPLIILASVLFSTIGVFGGLATFKMDFIVVMTGIGIVSLAGVVVNNAIVLIDYIELLKMDKRKELGLHKTALLPIAEATDCIIRGGKTRLRPVLLTAITTILGLLPMAIGVNIDFAGLLRSFEPNIYFGGDIASLWGPISWTVIFGLTFATFLTLIIVPVMYRITTKLQIFINELINGNKNQ
ncbi:MAG: efflux RND transporter permease subunit [Bacteroidales bacterium]|nr:efflux RND transporter permease subunit [Bacteroidales bacterium]